jgi:hypothetical protein
MISTNSFKPGRIYTVVYSDSSIEMKGFVKTPEGRKDNPLSGNAVAVRRVTRVQAAGNETWSNVNRAKNPDWQPSADYSAWWHVLPENSCIVEHNLTATRYLRGIPKGIVSEEYTVDGKPATEAELAIIAEFKKNKGGSEFCFLTLDKLENVVDETGDEE